MLRCLACIGSDRQGGFGIRPRSDGLQIVLVLARLGLVRFVPASSTYAAAYSSDALPVSVSVGVWYSGGIGNGSRSVLIG